MKNEQCPCCAASSFQELYDVTSPTVHKEVGLPGLVRKCNACEMIFKSFTKNLDDLYNDAYAENFQQIEEYSGEVATKFFRDILKESKLRLVSDKTLELLDIGSGIGVLLDAARKEGFNTTGIEITEKLAAIARLKGHKVINKNVNDLTESNQYDIISMMDIIEHLEKPVAILQRLKQLLKPSGELVVYTPNHASLLVKIAHLMFKIGMRSAVDNIFACTHICFFTTKSLHKTFENAGYEIVKTRHFQYDTSRPGQKISAMAKIAINLIETLGTIIGLKGFRMVMYARKKL